MCACVKTSAEDDDFQRLSKGERDRERDRQIDRQTDRVRHRGRQTDSQSDRERESVCVCLFNLRGFCVLVCYVTLFRVSFGLLGINL